MSEGFQPVGIRCRRWAALRMTADLFVELLKPHADAPRYFRVVDHALPSDAHVVRYGYDPPTGDLLIILESDSFAILGPEERAPELRPPTCEIVFQKDPANV